MESRIAALESQVASFTKVELQKDADFEAVRRH